MATSDIEGEADPRANLGVERTQGGAEAPIDEAGRRLEDEARSFADRADAARSSAKEALGWAADQARAAASTASDTYADFRRRAQSAAETVDPFVRESPYSTVAIALLSGLVLGLLLGGGGARVVYVTPERG